MPNRPSRQPYTGADDLDLADQVTFCLFDDAGVATVKPATASFALTAAVLSDLLDRERLHVETTGALRVRDSAPPPSALAHTVLETLASQRDVLTVSQWLQYWAATEFASMAAERMVRLGQLRSERHRRRMRGETVVYEPVNRTLGPWLLLRLGRRFSGQDQLEARDLRLYGILAALDLTGRVHADVPLDALRQHLPTAQQLLFDHLRTAAAQAAMTGGA